MSADFSKAMKALDDELLAHAKRDRLTGVTLATFLSRGGHAPGTECPSQPKFMTHEPWCDYYYDDYYETCNCGYRDDLAW